MARRLLLVLGVGFFCAETAQPLERLATMIGSIGSIGDTTSSQRLGRTVERASGRYVEPSESATTSGRQDERFALADLRSEAAAEPLTRGINNVVGVSASAPFMAQLAALGLSDSGERRVRRDPSLVASKADALYRDGYRRVTDLEPGFFGTAEY